MANWKDIVGAVAPALATALGGPLAGVAVKAIAGKVLGKPEASEAEVEQAILGMPPEHLVALKQAEYAYLQSLEDAGIKHEEIHQKDRDSARQREIAVKDYVPGLLALTVIVGFGWVLSVLLTTAAPPDNQDVLFMLLGSLAAAVGQVLAYYFGSSSGSKLKTQAMERMKK